MKWNDPVIELWLSHMSVAQLILKSSPLPRIFYHSTNQRKENGRLGVTFSTHRHTRTDLWWQIGFLTPSLSPAHRNAIVLDRVLFHKLLNNASGSRSDRLLIYWLCVMRERYATLTAKTQSHFLLQSVSSIPPIFSDDKLAAIENAVCGGTIWHLDIW